MNQFLVSFSSYFPWIVALVIALLFREPIINLVKAFEKRMKDITQLTFDPTSGQFAFIADTQDAVDQAAKQGKKFEFLGDPDQLKILFKAQGFDWKKSTKALEVPGGCIIQMTTDRLGRDGGWATSEAMVFVQGASVQPDGDKGAHTLVPAVK